MRGNGKLLQSRRRDGGPRPAAFALLTGFAARRIIIAPRRAVTSDAPGLPKPTPGRHRNEQHGYITAHRRIATPPSTAFTTHWRT